MNELYLKLYDYIKSKKKFGKCQLKKGLIENFSFLVDKIDLSKDNIVEQLYIYSTGNHSKKCLSKKCNNYTKFYTFKEGYRKFCSNRCHYDYKHDTFYKSPYQPLYELSDDKSEILNFVKKHVNRIGQLKIYKNLTPDEKYKMFILDTNLHNFLPRELIENFSALSFQEYLIGKRTCRYCHKNMGFNFFGRENKFCSNDCLFKWRSLEMQGYKNHVYLMSPEKKIISGKKISFKIKKAIAEGRFTPNITNSWAHSMRIVNIIRNNEKILVKVRSSWEAYFQIVNPECLYEKIRIPYEHCGKIRSYIVDFVDIKNKILYEIKPLGFKNKFENILKETAAIKWSLDNGYKFYYIDDTWFKKNYDELKLIDQSDKDEIKRLLKQFVA